METHGAGTTFRELWPLKPGIAFFNHGSFGSCPKPILELQAELRRQMEAEPIQFLWRGYEERLEPSRQELAAFLGARAQDVVFVANATTAVNAVVSSTAFKPGDEILTTSLDYNACRNALGEWASRFGARVVVADVPFPIRDSGEALESILRFVTPRTRLAMIDHVTSGSAVVLPVADIVRELESRGVEVLIDGAHAPGMLPLNLGELRPSYYTGNLHKWVCAPKGAAFLWVREDKQSLTRPTVISHGWNTPRSGYSKFQDLFDWPGTHDPTSWMCVGETLRWMGALLPGGWPEIRERNHALALSARALLARKLNLPLPCPEEMLGAMATLPLPEALQGKLRDGKVDSEQMRLYDQYGVEVPFFRFGSPERRWFRISAPIYNDISDYERLAAALGDL